MSDLPSTADQRHALVALYDQALPDVYGYLASRCGSATVAEDLTSETFLAAVDAIRRRAPAVSAAATTPYLTVHHGVAAIEWYVEAFGAEEQFRVVGDDDSIGHAELTVGKARFMLSDEYPTMGVVSPRTTGGTTVAIHLEVDDVDELYRRAVRAGATDLGPSRRLGAVSCRRHGGASGTQRAALRPWWDGVRRPRRRGQHLELRHLRRRCERLSQLDPTSAVVARTVSCHRSRCRSARRPGHRPTALAGAPVRPDAPEVGVKG